MPKSIKKKIVKKAAPEIEIKGIFSKLHHSLDRNRSIFIGVAAAFILIIAGAAGFFVYRGAMNNKAEKLNYEAYKAYYMAYNKQPFSNEERLRKALELFQKAYDAKASPVALFYIADCYSGMGKYDEAIKSLMELNQKFPDDEQFVPLTYSKLAVISLKKGNTEAALKYLDVLYRYKTGTYRDLALFESGKILEWLGKPDEANKKYEEMSKDFPQSPFTQEFTAKNTKK